jgi:hypothetical protein
MTAKFFPTNPPRSCQYNIFFITPFDIITLEISMGDSVCTICPELDDEYILGKRVMQRGTKKRAQYATNRRMGFTYQGEKEFICRRSNFSKARRPSSVHHILHQRL